MDAAEYERLRSWLLEIVPALLPGIRWRDEGNQRRFLGQAGLLVNRRSGAWYSYAAGQGEYSPFPLIRLLGKYDRTAALQWGAAWLAAHPGTGEIGGTGADDDHSPASKAAAERVLARLVDITDTPAEIYLKARRIEPTYPADIKYLPDARIGEGAIVFLLKARNRTVGVQLGYLDPDGIKSVVIPQRRRLMLERAADAALDIPSPGNGVAEIIIACGLEDALAIHRWSRRSTAARNWRILGLPGDGSLRHIAIDKGTTVTVCRDGDEPGSPADDAVRAGLDHLLIQAGHAPEWSTHPNTASIFVTKTPLGEDANSILIGQGVDGLTALLDNIERAELSQPQGVIRWLASLDRLACDLETRKAASKIGVRVAILREEIDAWRKRVADHDPDEPEPEEGLLDEVVDIGQTLDNILTEIRRYVVAPDIWLAVAALWSAHTHLVHSEQVVLSISPRLAIQARDYGSGKSTLLTVIKCLVGNPRKSSSVTASTVLRTMGSVKPTLLLDEADALFGRHMNEDLRAIFDAGHCRWDAFVERSVPTPDGGWTVVRFPAWGAIAFASVGELPRSIQERSIVVPMQKVLLKDILAKLEDGSSPALQLAQKQLATWAHSLDDLPKPAEPASLKYQPGRVWDNWKHLVQIADVAGGRWPNLVRAAIREAAGMERQLSPIQRLLASTKAAYQHAPTKTDAKEVDRLTTQQFLGLLLQDEEEEWGTANRGRPITAYWLRDNLRGLLNPPGAQQWWIPEHAPRSEQKHERGYLKTQFKKAWETYLDSEQPIPDDPEEYVYSKPDSQSGTSDTYGSSDTTGGNAGFPENDFVPDHSNLPASDTESSDSFVPDHADVRASGTENSGKNGGFPGTVSDEPDVSHVPDRLPRLEGTDGRRRNGPAAEPPSRPKHFYIKDVEAFVDEHPDCDAAQVARHFGQPRNVIDRIFKSLGR